MQETALQTPAKKMYLEARNEILSIQKACILIKSNNIRSIVNIHKSEVDEFTFDYLHAYFAGKIITENFIEYQKVLSIESADCKIFVPLKNSENDAA